MTKKPDTFTRAAAIRGPRTINEESRGFDVIAASDAPVQVYDWESARMVDEILIASGFALPRGRKQVPLQDSHNTMTVAATLGSARNFSAAGDEVHASVEFAADAESNRAFELYKAGHLTDFSVRYSRDKVVMLDEGKKKSINGREYVGPAMLVTRWTIKELSPTPIGADERAVARSEAEVEAATSETTMEVEPMTVEKRSEETVPASPPAAVATPPDVEQIRAEAIRAEQARAAGIKQACRTAGVPEIEEDLILGNVSIDQARARIIEELGKRNRPVGVGVSPITTQADEMDKFRAAATDAIMLRANVRIANPAPGATDLRGMSLLRLGEEWMRMNGVQTSRMTTIQIADKLLRLRGEYLIANGVSQFTHILLDAFNKSLLSAFNEAPQTWSRWCAIRDVADFKNINAISLSEAPNLVAVNEKGEYTEASFNDRKETYALGTKGLRYTLSRQAIISDDMSAFDRIPLLFGRASMRYIESAAWANITANAAMADGYTLFDNTNHRNNPTAAALSSTSLSAAITAFSNQTGFGADSAYIGAIPKLLLVPTDLVWTADIIAGSPNLPEATMPSIPNPAARYRLEVIPSPYLHANSTTAWYLLADPRDIPTVEIAFLQGTNRGPEAFEKDQVDPDGRVYHVRLDIGSDVAAFEGALKNNGA